MRYNKLTECILKNELGIFKDSVILECTTAQTDCIDIINDFDIYNNYEIISVEQSIDLEDIGDLYRYILEKDIYIDSLRIKTRGLIIGDEANLILKDNLILEDI